MSRVDKALNIADLKKIARKRLPDSLFHYVDGGSDDEGTRRANALAFKKVKLIPEYLVDVSRIDTATTILGQPVQWPVMCSPTGMSRLFHPDGELAVARAARNAGTYYSLSTMGSCSIEQVAAASDGPKCFQIYVTRERSLVREFIQRSKESGFTALALTVDVPVQSNREREMRYGFTLPPRIGARALASFLTRPRWVWNHLTGKPKRLENLAHQISEGSSGSMSLFEFISRQLDTSVDWDDLAFMIEEWGGPFLIKGILSPADAVRAAEAGCTAVMVSNHGGRQLDESVTPFDALPGIVEAVGDRCEVILDGGVRRGTDVLKALALGADACSIGRPYIWGLAAGGEAGVSRALTLLREDVERCMALLGCTKLADIGARHVCRV